MENNMASALRPFRPIKPGEILQEELEARGWTQADLAEIVDRPVQAINEIVAGKKAITPGTALALAHALGTSPEYWLNLEAAYRLDLLHGQGHGNEIARRAQLYTMAPVKELLKRQWIDVSNPHDIDALEQALCHFLAIPSPHTQPGIRFAARKTLPDSPHNAAQTAWACRVRYLATQMRVSHFAPSHLTEAIPQLPRLSQTEDDTRRLPSALAELGVRFVIAEPLPRTRIDGGAMWLDEQSPVVAVSLRYDRFDGFWFTLMHELAHIIAGDTKRDFYVDTALVGQDAEPPADDRDAERAADARASEWLIPESAFTSFLRGTRPYFSRGAVLAFAQEMRVHPAIVVGRLQHRRIIPWTHHRHLLSKIRHVFAGEYS
jgi:HTH-type transcriptional regulator / antitoxin HigA